MAESKLKRELEVLKLSQRPPTFPSHHKSSTLSKGEMTPSHLWWKYLSPFSLQTCLSLTVTAALTALPEIRAFHIEKIRFFF